MGSKEDVAARIEADTKIKIDEMNKAVITHKEAVSINFKKHVYNMFYQYSQVLHIMIYSNVL